MTTTRAGNRRPLTSLWLVLVAVTLAGCALTTRTESSRPRDDGDKVGTQGDGYAFVQTRADGQPIRWSTCEPIRYVVREENEPEGARELLEESVRRVSEATGLEFAYGGTTDEAPSVERPPYQPDRYGDTWAPVLIAYSDEDEYPRLQGQTAGYGGSAYVRAGRRTPRYVSGMVVLDVGTVDQMGGDEAWRGVMLHELAHVVGLAHVEDRSQLMNPVQYGRQVTTFQPGDLEGLGILGAGDCYEPIDPQSIRR